MNSPRDVDFRIGGKSQRAMNDSTPNSSPAPGAPGNTGGADAKPQAAGGVSGEARWSMGSSALPESINDPDRPVKDKIIDVLRSVYDPEIPINIYEMGLIYDLSFDEATGKAYVKMTLTSPACPVAESIPVEVKSKISRIAQVNEVEVDLVWDPPWKPELMTDAAKLRLGML